MATFSDRDQNEQPVAPSQIFKWQGGQTIHSECFTRVVKTVTTTSHCSRHPIKAGQGWQTSSQCSKAKPLHWNIPQSWGHGNIMKDTMQKDVRIQKDFSNYMVKPASGCQWVHGNLSLLGTQVPIIIFDSGRAWSLFLSTSTNHSITQHATGNGSPVLFMRRSRQSFFNSRDNSDVLKYIFILNWYKKDIFLGRREMGILKLLDSVFNAIKSKFCSEGYRISHINFCILFHRKSEK